jgi:CO/xanthine dehydrogenase Mo-binding subunit
VARAPSPAALAENQPTVSGHVDGQILRGSLQQKRKDEGPKDSISFEEAVVAAIDFHGALTGTGSYAPPTEARGGKHKGAGVGPSPAYSYSAQVAEVTVDEDTGEVTVHKVWAAHDCGRALNPVSVEGQIIGSVWMGMGQALTEEMVWKDGMLMNPGLLEYRSPRVSIPKAHSAPRNAAKVPSQQPFPRLPTPFMTRLVFACMKLPLLPSAYWPPCELKPRTRRLT